MTIIRYLDGRTPTGTEVNVDDAKETLLNRFPKAFFGNEEENYDGDIVRIPVWEDEESSIDDNGEGAVAYIEEVA